MRRGENETQLWQQRYGNRKEEDLSRGSEKDGSTWLEDDFEKAYRSWKVEKGSSHSRDNLVCVCVVIAAKNSQTVVGRRKKELYHYDCLYKIFILFFLWRIYVYICSLHNIFHRAPVPNRLLLLSRNFVPLIALEFFRRKTTKQDL